MYNAQIELQPAKIDLYRKDPRISADARCVCRAAVARELLKLHELTPLEPDDFALLRHAYQGAKLQAARHFGDKYVFANSPPLTPPEHCEFFDELLDGRFESFIDDLRFLPESELHREAAQRLSPDEAPEVSSLEEAIASTYASCPTQIDAIMLYYRVAMADALHAHGGGARIRPENLPGTKIYAMRMAKEDFADAMAADTLQDDVPREIYARLFQSVAEERAAFHDSALFKMPEEALKTEAQQPTPGAAELRRLGDWRRPAANGELDAHLRYHAALFMLDWRRTAPGQRLDAAARDLVRRYAVIATGGTLGRHHDLTRGFGTARTRRQIEIDAVADMVGDRILSIIPDNFLGQHPDRLAKQIATTACFIQHAPGTLPPDRPGLKAAMARAAGIIHATCRAGRPAADAAPIFDVLPQTPDRPVERLRIF